jgi:hypothetical protein
VRGILFALLAAALLPAGVTLAHAADAAAGSSATGSYANGGYLVGSLPMGDWGKIAGFGIGIDGANIVHTTPDKPFGIRSNLGWLYNFARTQDIPQANLQGANDKLSVETKNLSLYFGLGPEIGKPAGGLFAFGTVGFNTYWTSSNMSGTAGGAPYDSKFGDSRIAFAWSAGAGIRKPSKSGPGKVELSGEYRSGGGHMFIDPDQVTNTGTTVNVERKARTTDQVLIRLGSVF